MQRKTAPAAGNDSRNDNYVYDDIESGLPVFDSKNECTPLVEFVTNNDDMEGYIAMSDEVVPIVEATLTDTEEHVDAAKTSTTPLLLFYAKCHPDDMPNVARNLALRTQPMSLPCLTLIVPSMTARQPPSF
jgi:hypothetical protein